MIFDVVQRSLQTASTLIPVEQLLGNCTGSHMPDVQPALLTASIARRAAEACPTSALAFDASRSHLTLNYRECTGCGRCIEVGEGAFFAAARFARCGVSKEGLVKRFDLNRVSEITPDQPAMAETAEKIRGILGRALNIREVDAGSCNGCEGEIIALTNPYCDLERFGIHFVASPKHADMLLVTGPVTRNMAEAVRQTYEATPPPSWWSRLVLAGVVAEFLPAAMRLSAALMPLSRWTATYRAARQLPRCS